MKIDELRNQLPNWDWNEYMDALKQLDDCYYEECGLAVLNNEQNSWLHTAQTVLPLIQIPLNDLTHDERAIVFGKTKGLQQKQQYPGLKIGLCGRLDRAKKVMHIAKSDDSDIVNIRDDISSALDKLGNISNPLEGGLVEDIFNELMKIDGIGIATISRLLTLRRPDSLMVVNEANTQGMAQAFRIKKKAPWTCKQYLEVHQKLWRSKFWNSQMPKDINGKKIWSFRAMLIDPITTYPNCF